MTNKRAEFNKELKPLF